MYVNEKNIITILHGTLPNNFFPITNFGALNAEDH